MKNDFRNITENLALNFCNSIILRQGKIIDLFNSIDTFKLWLETPIDNNEDYNRQLSVMYSCLDITLDLDAIKQLRAELTEIITKVINNSEAIDEIKIEIESVIGNSPFNIIFVGDEPLMIPVEKGINGMRTILFLSLADLIQSGELKKIVKCANKKCPSFFINQSGRRKWCSMSHCGNRNKVERFLNKTKST